MLNLYWFVLFPIIIALIAYLSKSKILTRPIILLQLIFLGLGFWNFYNVKMNGEVVQVLGDYTRGLGIALRSDLISSVFVLLTIFLFTCMYLFNYHKDYMNKLFLFLFLILQGLINGIFLSADLFNIYILIEVSTIVVSILIMFKKDSQSIYDGMVYLLTNLVSMTFFLLGIGYIYRIFGSLDLVFISDNITKVTTPKTLIVPYCLIITSIGLKAAIMPLFSWLPRAHGTPSAPSIISALLSGLYVKGGVYLFIRIQDIFNPVIDTSKIFLIMGFLTAIIGFIFALSQTDIKLILAYHTVSQIGLIIFGISLNYDYSYWGSIYHIINHAIFKSTLFLTAGIIIEEYDTRNIYNIKGVFKRMPFVTIITIFAILGITGAPLFNGSVSKYLINKGTYSNHYLEYGLLIINLGTIMSFVKYSSIFYGNTNKRSKIPINQKMVLSILASICFLGGILGHIFIGFLFNVHINISLTSYIEKTIMYIISLIVGLVFYKYVYKKIKAFKLIREIELSFNHICFSIVSFFTVMLVYMLSQF
jgi:multicomponent Na+:H+ antiporter subunit D